ncbi:shikimate dehydrogenase [Paenibacillus sp. y28]|uniref:shikimate dehydrogenase n=1 Tax=Paenibacillus sp. y28 TaxID=3129110 RepID=UPI0030184168
MAGKNSVPINTETVLYGVFGDPVRQSKSPLMLNRAFQETGVNAAYAAFHITPGTLRAAVEGIRALGFRGVNVTIPHKLEVMQYLDEIHEDARVIGAVNTIVNENGRLTGYNTDGIGYVRSLKEETGIQLAGKRVLIVGAGGASRGVTYALAKEGPAQIWIANRTVDKAQALAADLAGLTQTTGMGLDQITDIKHEVDLVVNLTSQGMHPNVAGVPLDTSWFRPGLVVSDTVYNPLLTRMLREAKEAGATIHPGLGMFIYQGAFAFEYWTGIPAPVSAMREVVEAALAGA